VAESFGLLLIGIAWMGDPELQAWITIDHAHLQTALFLQLVAGGHLLLFVTRAKRFFLAPPLPSLPLFGAIVTTQVFAVRRSATSALSPPPIPRSRPKRKARRSIRPCSGPGSGRYSKTPPWAAIT
jgi:H+-transporting ATPase